MVVSPPLLECIETKKAVIETVNGRSIVRRYGSFYEEYSALHNTVGIHDLSNGGIIVLKGGDTIDYLHRISTNNIKNLQRGESINTIFTTENGRIIDVIRLIHCGDMILGIGSGIYEEKLLKWIDKYIIMDDVEAASGHGKYILLEICGPRAENLITTLSGGAGNDLKLNIVKQGIVDAAPLTLLKLKSHKNVNKFWLLAEVEHGKALFRDILQEKYSNAFQLTGSEAYNVFRIEQGIPSAPYEINEDVNPHEAHLIDDVSFTKGCYIGQEVIARLDTYDKVQKHLRGIVSIDESIQTGVQKLYTHDGKSAGTLTSLAYSPRLDRFIGLGFIRKNYAEEGTQLIAHDDRKNTFAVTVADIPFER